MIELENVLKPPASGFHLSYLTFLKHPMAIESENISTMGDNHFDAMLASTLSMKQAWVKFGNKFSASIVTHIPYNDIMLVHGDERIPTYEVMIYYPNGDPDGPYSNLDTNNVDALLNDTMFRVR